MEIDVTATLDEVDFNPTKITEIIQNVKTILTTTKYQVPLNREFGLSATMLDAPTPVAQARLTAEIIDAIQRWEPRAEVVSVVYVGNIADAADGILQPKVRIKIND